MLAQAGARLNPGHLHQIANHDYRRITIAERSADLPEFLRPSVRSNLLSTLRTAIDFLHDASDAASVAIALGSAFGLDDATMRRLVHGMILRDVGMLALLANLLDGDDPLTPEDRLRMHEHPLRADTRMLLVSDTTAVAGVFAAPRRPPPPPPPVASPSSRPCANAGAHPRTRPRRLSLHPQAPRPLYLVSTPKLTAVTTPLT